MESEKKPLKVGPFGSDSGGERFDDGVHSTVRQVVLCSSLSSILYIQIEYDDDGSSSWSRKHGCRNPIGVDKIETVSSPKKNINISDNNIYQIHHLDCVSLFLSRTNMSYQSEA